jgi:hypothetical protein
MSSAALACIDGHRVCGPRELIVKGLLASVAVRVVVECHRQHF